jgi:hypothetical protein
MASATRAQQATGVDASSVGCQPGKSNGASGVSNLPAHLKACLRILALIGTQKELEHE